MPDAVDIITYVGVPLAVLGVLPTIYTCLRSIVTLRSIRRILDLNGVSAITRSSLLSGIVEIEIPRKSIIPLDRHDPAYFEFNDKPAEGMSRLRGGTWTLFNWNEMVIGTKSYRVQYHDELSQPQAEVEFEALIAFLLDRGAVPDRAGFSDLRSSGLWTPAGTKLLLSPCTKDAVLMVATQADGDGILSLSLEWEREWDRRSKDSLPPYWLRVRAPRDVEIATGDEKVERPQWKEEELPPHMVFKPIENDEQKAERMRKEADEEAARREEAEKPKEDDESSISYQPRSAVRMRIASTGLTEAYYEDEEKVSLSLPHLRHDMAKVGFWFAIACTAVGSPAGGLWSFAIPEDILHLSRIESVPCGVLCMLSLVSEDSVPAWRTQEDETQERLEEEFRRERQMKALMEEARISTPKERSQAWLKRVERENMERQQDQRRKIVEAEARKERVVKEALASPRLGIGRVAEAARVYLVAEGLINREETMGSVVERVLYRMVQETPFAAEIANMLEAWRLWSESGGMLRPHFDELKKNVPLFCQAACVIALVKEASATESGSVVSDLQECLRIWRKVRLG